MSLVCDNYDQWFHADCQGIGNTTFDILSHTKATYCHQCNFPKHSQGLSETLDTLTDTSLPHHTHTYNSSILYSVTSKTDDSSTQSQTQKVDSTEHSDPFGHPQASSSPKVASQPDGPHIKPKQKPPPKCLTILNINCR